MLFGDKNTPFSPDKKTDPNSDYPPGKMIRRNEPVAHKWTTELAFQARAMVLADKTLFVSGWPDVVDPADPYTAIDGRKGGVMWAISASDGRKLIEYKLKSPPVFDGLIAADGRLYMTMKNGTLACSGRSD